MNDANAEIERLRVEIEALRKDQDRLLAIIKELKAELDYERFKHGKMVGVWV